MLFNAYHIGNLSMHLYLGYIIIRHWRSIFLHSPHCWMSTPLAFVIANWRSKWEEEARGKGRWQSGRGQRQSFASRLSYPPVLDCHATCRYPPSFKMSRMKMRGKPLKSGDSLPRLPEIPGNTAFSAEFKKEKAQYKKEKAQIIHCIKTWIWAKPIKPKKSMFWKIHRQQPLVVTSKTAKKESVDVATLQSSPWSVVIKLTCHHRPCWRNNHRSTVPHIHT